MAVAPSTAETPEAMDDRTLMGRVQLGDEAALATLMERWELPVKAVIARLVLNTGEAEDLAQETFVRVWQQRAKFRAGAAFRPWIFAIAVNLARNRLRWWRRRPAVALEEWTELRGEGAAGGGFAPLGKMTAAAPAGGAAALERAEVGAAVRDAIAELPADQREALVLFEYEQLSHAEIADVVGATPKAVETRLYRARERLRKSLAGLI